MALGSALTLVSFALYCCCACTVRRLCCHHKGGDLLDASDSDEESKPTLALTDGRTPQPYQGVLQDSELAALLADIDEEDPLSGECSLDLAVSAPRARRAAPPSEKRRRGSWIASSAPRARGRSSATGALASGGRSSTAWCAFSTPTRRWWRASAPPWRCGASWRVLPVSLRRQLVGPALAGAVLGAAVARQGPEARPSFG
ncbi:unnamed protein product, partial [Prorocentrum cordatum]